MKKTDVTCPICGAGFRRLELWSKPGAKGGYKCPACGYLLEVFDGTKLVAYRLTIQPMRFRERGHSGRVNTSDPAGPALVVTRRDA